MFLSCWRAFGVKAAEQWWYSVLYMLVLRHGGTSRAAGPCPLDIHGIRENLQVTQSALGTHAGLVSQWDFADSSILSSRSRLVGRLFNSIREYPTSFAYSALCWMQLLCCSRDATASVSWISFNWSIYFITTGVFPSSLERLLLIYLCPCLN